MFCESCGAKNDERSQFCENCGAPLTPPPLKPATPTQLEGQAPSAQSPEGVIYAKIGVVVGALGIFLFFLFILGPVAIILGYVGYTKGDTGTGKIAMILGGIATMLSLLVSAVFI